MGTPVSIIEICLVLFATLTGLLTIALSSKFTQGQRQRFPFLRALDGKQILLVGSACLFLFAAGILKFVQLYLSNQVKISPTSVTFVPGIFNTYGFTIVNNKDVEVYMVSIELEFDAGSITTRDVLLDAPKETRKEVPGNNSPVKVSDIQGLICENSRHHTVIMMSIYHMLGKETRQITLTALSPLPKRVRARVAGFDTKAPGVFADSGGPTIPLRPWSSDTCTDVFYLPMGG